MQFDAAAADETLSLFHYDKCSFGICDVFLL